MISKILNSLNANRNRIINPINTKNSIKFFESNFHSFKTKSFFTLEKKQNGNFEKNLNSKFNFSSKNPDEINSSNYFNDLGVYETEDNGKQFF